MINDDRVPPARNALRRLSIFIALFYVAEGLAQPGGLINQPLTFYLKQTLGWSADHVAEFLSIMVLPLVIKPLYGVLSDSIPLLGYRRRTYLLLFSTLALCGYVSLTFFSAPVAIFIALLGVAFAMAANNTISGAVIVENGKANGNSGTLINQQWLWFNVAALFVSFGGGWLTNHLAADSAYRWAAAVAALAPAAVLALSWFLVSEKRATTNGDRAGQAWHEVTAVVTSRTFWVVGGFLVFYNFSPGLGTPLFYHMTDHLRFSQQFIGMLGSVSAIGAIIGALLYQLLQKRLTLKQLLNLSIALAACGHFGYLLLASDTSAVVLSLINGAIGMVVLVSSLTLAANSCPDGSEGFSYALLTSLATFSYIFSTSLGAVLYEHIFARNLTPLIIVSATLTAAALMLVPVLKLGARKAGEKE